MQIHEQRFIAAAGALLFCSTSAAAQVSVGAQTQIDTGRGVMPCNETTMAASPSNPLEIVAGWNDYRLGGTAKTGVGLSMDGGETWTDFLLRPPPANQAFDRGRSDDRGRSAHGRALGRRHRLLEQRGHLLRPQGPGGLDLPPRGDDQRRERHRQGLDGRRARPGQSERGDARLLHLQLRLAVLDHHGQHLVERRVPRQRAGLPAARRARTASTT